MARWAKKQSKVLLAVKAPPKLETTSPLVTAAKPKTAAVEPTADLTYKMLEKTSVSNFSFIFHPTKYFSKYFLVLSKIYVETEN